MNNFQKIIGDILVNKIMYIHSKDKRITTMINIRLINPLWFQVTTQVTDQLLFNIDLK